VFMFMFILRFGALYSLYFASCSCSYIPPYPRFASLRSSLRIVLGCLFCIILHIWEYGVGEDTCKMCILHGHIPNQFM
jgi:hypothetical protein